VSFQELQVFYDTGASRDLVGTLAIADQRVLFEYETGWQRQGIELAPYTMPIARRTFAFERAKLPCEIPGLCADSLPDGWGMLLMDRIFARQGIDRSQISPIDRLAYLGEHAMGALTYQPAIKTDERIEAIEIGAIAREAYKVFSGDIGEISQLLNKVGGSPGGARPKALIGFAEDGRQFVSGSGALPDGYTHWLVKFSSPVCGELSDLGPFEGVIESIYLQMAAIAGIRVPEYMLLQDNSLFHLAVRRFDRPRHDRRLHVATAFGLLDADFRSPSLDYVDLIKLAWAITRDAREVHEQYRRAVFNFMAVNRDDHAKNHGYLFGEDGKWRLAPAYDLIFSRGPGGEHWTSFLGEGKAPSRETLLDLAAKGSIDRGDALMIIDQVQDAVGKFPGLCKQHSVPAGTIKPLLAEQKKALKSLNSFPVS